MSGWGEDLCRPIHINISMTWTRGKRHQRADYVASDADADADDGVGVGDGDGGQKYAQLVIMFGCIGVSLQHKMSNRK